uniref:Uncharacterized protein n=1 Tax=Arundo donax TaxID=35708 RepID=A0A0A9B534_ARUDO
MNNTEATHIFYILKCVCSLNGCRYSNIHRPIATVQNFDRPIHAVTHAPTSLFQMTSQHTHPRRCSRCPHRRQVGAHRRRSRCPASYRPRTTRHRRSPYSRQCRSRRRRRRPPGPLHRRRPCRRRRRAAAAIPVEHLQLTPIVSLATGRRGRWILWIRSRGRRWPQYKVTNVVAAEVEGEREAAAQI